MSTKNPECQAFTEISSGCRFASPATDQRWTLGETDLAIYFGHVRGALIHYKDVVLPVWEIPPWW